MGQVLTYEIGVLNLGRHVKVKPEGGGDPHGRPGVLKEAHRDHAVVQGAGVRLEKAKWSNVRDWTSHNDGPLVMPPVGTVAVKKEPVRLEPTPVPVVDAVSPFAVFGDLSMSLPAVKREIDDAEEEVDGAMELLHQAKARHAAAVAKMASLRASVSEVSKLLDGYLVGTSKA